MPSRFEPLRPNDAFFLHAETPGAHQHVAGLAVLDASARPEGPVRLEEITARLVPQLGDMPRLRQRLAVPWGGLARAAWVDAADFEVTDHVRSLQVAAPGDGRQLEEAIEAIVSEPLDRSRPLWELYLLDGLEHGRQGLVVKLHHAIADGIGALALAERLLDHSGHSPEPWVRSPAPRGAELFSSTLAYQLAAPWRDLYGTARRTVADPRRAWRRTARTVTGIWQLARAGSAAPTALNRPVRPGRRIVLAEVPRPSVREARRRDGGTDNDVVLAAVGAALHQWFASHEGTAPSSVRTMVPVSTRRGRKEAPGSWTATLDIDLPVGPMEPRERLRAVVAATRKAKRSDQAVGSQVVMSAVGTLAPPFLHARFARFAYRGTWFNLIVSNVPGPRSPRFLAGAPVVAAYPIIPLAEQVGLTIAALTWGDAMTLGFTADPTQIEDLDKLASSMVTFIHDLAEPDP
jgi:WS/DGAT/MGAT family acyltransferase